MSVVDIRGVRLGEGIPKICVPLTGKTIEDLQHSLEAMKGQPFDLIEWRADKYEKLFEKESVLEASSLIRAVFPDCPLIFTIRTSRDMEDFEISTEDYTDINRFVIQEKAADLIDIEFSHGADTVRAMAEEAHRNGLYIIASKHIADSTPEAFEVVEIMTRMQSTAADIVKFACMPQSAEDVLALLSATITMHENYSETPIITMSMSRLGVLSRISGGLTGSCLTFGTVGSASAPGQIPCNSLRKILAAL